MRRDPILGRILPVMTAMFPEARLTETEAGHFLQEDVPAEIAEAIERVVATVEAEESATR